MHTAYSHDGDDAGDDDGDDARTRAHAHTHIHARTIFHFPFIAIYCGFSVFDPFCTEARADGSSQC